MRVRAFALVAVCCLLVLSSCSSDNPSSPSTSVMDQITDLRVSGNGYNWATLAWNSLGADPAGFSYDARYLHVSEMGGLEEITEALWAVADTLSGEPLPSEAGVAESLMVSGLVAESEYYAVVRTVRHADGEMSDISNTVRIATDAVILDCRGPGLAIPDDNPVGVGDIITTTRDLSITDVAVGVDITHTWIGDLIVEVTSPGGTTVRLHNETGGSEDNIFGWYGNGPADFVPMPVDGPGSLDEFNGQTSLGDWTLTVSDNAGFDLGTLNEWCIMVSGVEP